MDVPRYKYEPLQLANEIRVLKLGKNRTRIEVCILHVPVASRAFRALSYVWGNPQEAGRATITEGNGQALGWIPLTKNLDNAMRNLRDTEGLENECFWIDQICINQQDEEEKGQQVAMMSHIYTESRQVITYLGPAGIEEEELRGIRLLKRIHEYIPDETWQQMYKVGNAEIWERYMRQGWNWLIQVAYGEWTQRLWIVQEQLLNKNVIMLRGDRLIDWNAIATLPILFGFGHLPQQYRDTARRMLGGNAVPAVEVERSIYGLWWDRQARLQTETVYTWSPLCHNLQWYQSLLCRDPRDRVYAILAISKDSAALSLNPDYSSMNTPDTLSRHLSVRVLQNGHNLELLSFSLSWRQPHSTLPSWCLNLDIAFDANSPANVPVEVYKPHPIWQLKESVRFRSNDSVLIVRGRIIDNISTKNYSTVRIHETTNISSQNGFLRSLVSTVPDNFHMEDISRILDTTTARAPWSPQPTAQATKDEVIAFYFWVYLRYLLRLLVEETGSILPTSDDIIERCDRILQRLKVLAPRNPYPECEITAEITESEFMALEKVLIYSLEEGRCLGRTATQRFFNATHSVQEGDPIVALQGSDQLYVIRLVGGTYKLITDVFVDGMMNGEAYENVHPDMVDCDIALA
ncbi:HET-domain-containing protein [Macroventuria anomochaeta]|uniref:HET-domain-containing protein n=1 Tax=Macroventuria anomochaeta TaxID=301207 RepID=A0ACB6RHJ9_9PLEO|nr:HET-domain-containing protein [Macroventuria anomochaeta]KAF2621167.1 HET-domain-containing protein [Macroventuria anomochaeta]